MMKQRVLLVSSTITSPMRMIMSKRQRGLATQQVTTGNNIMEKKQSNTTLVPCPILTAALPRLRTLFDKLSSKNDNVFPLFTPSVVKRIWDNVDKNNNKTTTNSQQHRRQAAILVPLVSLQGVPSLLFTVRSSHLSTHAAEVSFPGGHFDDNSAQEGGGGDVTLQDTALREAQEELLGTEYPWNKPGGVEILGCATALPSITGTSVTPIIAVLPYIISNDTFPGNDQEVDEIFYVSLENLVKMETYEKSSRFQSDIPVYPVDNNKIKIWGLTAVVTRPILHKLFKPIFLS